MITIQRNPDADTRTCDVSTVSKEQLIRATIQHIKDVSAGMMFFIDMIYHAKYQHDRTKITHIDDFYHDFQTKFEQHSWYDMHKELERHHIASPDGIRDDVNIIDLIEHIVDCVMAGMSRSGAVYPIELPDELLQKIVKNTVDLLMRKVKVSE